MSLPYRWRVRIAPYTYYLIGVICRDQDLKNLAKEIKYQVKREDPEMVAEAQMKFKTILTDRYLAG